MAIVGDIPTFADNTGSLVQDSGILAAALMTSVNGARGIVRMFLPGGGGVAATIPWTVVTPDGSAVPSIGSTHSNGFNETEAYAYTKGWSIEVSGAGENSTSSSLMSVLQSDAGSGGFVLKPLAQRYLKLKGVIMQSFAQTTLKIDSMVEGGIFQEGGQILNIGTAGAITVDIAPSTIIPNEGFVGVGASWIQLPNISMQTSGGAGDASLRINLAGGGINQTFIEAPEINGGGSGGATANYALRVVNDAVNFIGGCVFRFGLLHNTLLGLLKTGATVSHMNGCIFDIGMMSNNAGILVDEFGINNIYRIGVMNGTYSVALQAEIGASGSTYTVGQISGASTASGNNPGINDLSGWRNNYCVAGNWLNITIGAHVQNGFKPTSVTNGTLGTDATNGGGSFVTTNGASTTFALVFSVTLPDTPTVIVGNPGNIVAWISATGPTGFTITTAGVVPNGTTINYLVR